MDPVSTAVEQTRSLDTYDGRAWIGITPFRVVGLRSRGRYCLYALRDGQLPRAEIHQPSWPLQPAEARLSHDGLVPAGVELLADEPLLHFSSRQDVVVWSTEAVGAGR